MEGEGEAGDVSGENDRRECGKGGIRGWRGIEEEDGAGGGRPEAEVGGAAA